MAFKNSDIARVLSKIDLGSSVAESDTLLELARVETSAFTDIINDRVDLIPGTKGSGKSALYRIFVDFMPETLLAQRKVVVAHGVRVAGDDVFHAFRKDFERLDETDFLNFWCVYLVSLANQHFLRGEMYASYLLKCKDEVAAFRKACQEANIPLVEKRGGIREALEWALAWVLQRVQPHVKVNPDNGTPEFHLFRNLDDQTPAPIDRGHSHYPRYAHPIKEALERIIQKANLHLWLMVDRLDEIFPRRTEVETRALRGLLRTLQVFQSPAIRVKVFLRDDILEQITADGRGFAALTHVTARRADTLSWGERQILTLVVKRIFTSDVAREYLDVDLEQLEASDSYREDVFYRVFPTTVHRGSRQSRTLRWLYNHTMDGREVVTPRDVIELLTRAKQKEQTDCDANPAGESDCLISGASIVYGLGELSKYKRDTFLRAEFPHFWEFIEKLKRGKTEYGRKSLMRVLQSRDDSLPETLVSIGVLQETMKGGERRYKIPFLYREGLEVTQGMAD